MRVFMFQAALWCEACARATMAGKLRPAHVNPEDESSYDSGEWFKGPYTEGGGESDTPQHCDGCGLFLENPLTADGLAYVAERLAGFVADPHNGNADVLAVWREFYGMAEES